MNDLSATDIMMFGALAGALVAVLVGGLWALTRQGRKRFSADRRDEFYDRAAKVGHGGS